MRSCLALPVMCAEGGLRSGAAAAPEFMRCRRFSFSHGMSMRTGHCGTQREQAVHSSLKRAFISVPGTRFPRTANAAGIGFSAEGVSADGLKVGAGIQARAAANAIQRFMQHRIVAHAACARCR